MIVCWAGGQLGDNMLDVIEYGAWAQNRYYYLQMEDFGRFVLIQRHLVVALSLWQHYGEQSKYLCTIFVLLSYNNTQVTCPRCHVELHADDAMVEHMRTCCTVLIDLNKGTFSYSGPDTELRYSLMALAGVFANSKNRIAD
jgi:hypothetical protein